MMGSEEVHEYGEDTYHPEWHPRDWRANWKRISWGAIFAGTFVTLAVFLTLQMLGAGIGLASVDLTGGETSSGRALGIGAAVWWFIIGLISLFIGGWVAGRLGWQPVKLDRMLHGLTVWAFFYMIMFWVVTTAMGVLAGGGIAMLGQGVSAAGQAAGSSQRGPSSDAIQQEIASMIAGAGGTAQQGQQGQQMGQQGQGQAGAGELASAIANYYRGPQTEQERQRLAQVIAQQTGRSEAEANQMIVNLDRRAAQAKETGQEVANITGATFIGLAISMLLGAVVAALGSFIAPAPKYVPPHDYERPGAKTEATAYAAR